MRPYPLQPQDIQWDEQIFRFFLDWNLCWFFFGFPGLIRCPVKVPSQPTDHGGNQNKRELGHTGDQGKSKDHD
jgi:hypothetical protein